MLKVGDKVVIKNLDVLIQEKVLEMSAQKGLYINQNTAFVVFEDFPYFNKEATIMNIDKKDKEIPYFVSVANKFGIWMPEFMIQIPEEKEIVKENKQDNPEQVYINKFVQKPFGKLFLKLIELDPKIAEFSNITFGKLRKHELTYIMRVLKKHLDIKESIDEIEAMTQKDLAKICFKYTKQL